jgi:hypothetical protein
MAGILLLKVLLYGGFSVRPQISIVSSLDCPPDRGIRLKEINSKDHTKGEEKSEVSEGLKAAGGS